MYANEREMIITSILFDLIHVSIITEETIHDKRMICVANTLTGAIVSK